MAVAAAYLPLVQSMQVVSLVAAVAAEALPLTQLLHAADAALTVCLPLGHAAHSDAAVPPLLAYARPARQSVQVAVPVSVVCLPAGQDAHVGEAAVAYFPAIQLTQVVAPVAALALPLAQLLQTVSPLDVAPGLPYMPAAHIEPMQVERAPAPTAYIPLGHGVHPPLQMH